MLATAPIANERIDGEIFPFANFNLYRRPFGGDYTLAYAPCGDTTSIQPLPALGNAVRAELVILDCDLIAASDTSLHSGDCILAGRLYRDYVHTARGLAGEFIFVKRCL